MRYEISHIILAAGPRFQDAFSLSWIDLKCAHVFSFLLWLVLCPVLLRCFPFFPFYVFPTFTLVSIRQRTFYPPSLMLTSIIVG